MKALSEDSAADQRLDPPCDGDVPDMTHTSAVAAAASDHWVV